MGAIAVLAVPVVPRTMRSKRVDPTASVSPTRDPTLRVDGLTGPDRSEGADIDSATTDADAREDRRCGLGRPATREGTGIRWPRCLIQRPSRSTGIETPETSWVVSPTVGGPITRRPGPRPSVLARLVGSSPSRRRRPREPSSRRPVPGRPRRRPSGGVRLGDPCSENRCRRIRSPRRSSVRWRTDLYACPDRRLWEETT